ncbi:STAS/SEC14 domain-containing protein [Consotaella salsifontis]|uniref:SpoIIAA-like n=1 Tax=Consotaella salsifontis TaxID=1365950 RepID=A0A1T4T4N8_9HYPH|nr:STAS/SEC14 domain-containing protein [Consotaella salsifontis]SKA35118.1 SpoIIAA-like [Consotaella salsifontis]
MLSVTPSPSNILIIETRGKLDGDDIDRAIAAYEDKLAGAGEAKISTLAVLRDFDGMTAEALLKDVRYGLARLGDLGRVHRVAVVTDANWLRRIADLQNIVLPRVEIRAFPMADESSARSWLGLPPVTPTT